MTQQSAHTQVPMPAAKARAFYLESLKKEGWVTDDFAKGRPGSLSFRRRGSMLFLEVRETGDASCTVDYLLMQRY